MSPRVTLLALVTIAVALTGCQSTQDKSATLAASAQDAVREEGLSITEVSTDVQVRSEDVISGPNGTAVVVVLRNTSDQPRAQVPIAIDVRDAAGKTVFRNDSPGADVSLVAVPYLPPGEDVLWVHDQVLAAGGTAVEVTVGQAPPVPEAPVALLPIGSQAFEEDPASGVALLSDLTNSSPVEQSRVTVFAVAREGDEVRAAGRAVVPVVAPGANETFSVFFIGDPRQGELTLEAPPTVLP